MGNAHRRLRYEPLYVAGHVVDVVHAVVQEVDLALPVQLPADRFPDQVVAELRHVGLDRQPLLRRRLDRAHVAYARQRQVERARDGRRGKGQNVDFVTHLLEALLVGHAEALLLVYDDQSKVLERYVLLYQAVRTDAYVDAALGEALDHGPLLLPRPEAAQHVDSHRVGAQALGEGDVVLLGQHSGRSQDGHLFAVHDGLERRPERHLRLAVPHVSAHKSVHGAGALHVALHRDDGLLLVRRLLERERVFQFDLPRTIASKALSLCELAGGVQGDELGRHLSGGFGYPGLGALPLLAAEPGQRGGPVHRSDVGRHPVQVVNRNVEHVVLRVLDDQELPVPVIPGIAARASETPYAMLHVHDVVAGLELRDQGGLAGGAPPDRPPLLGGAEYLVVAQNDQLPSPDGESKPLAEPGARRMQDRDRALGWQQV